MRVNLHNPTVNHRFRTTVETLADEDRAKADRAFWEKPRETQRFQSTPYETSESKKLNDLERAEDAMMQEKSNGVRAGAITKALRKNLLDAFRVKSEFIVRETLIDVEELGDVLSIEQSDDLKNFAKTVMEKIDEAKKNAPLRHVVGATDNASLETDSLVIEN